MKIKKGLIEVEVSTGAKEQIVQDLLAGITIKLSCARSHDECATKIAQLKQNNATNVAKIGSVLSQFKEAYLTDKEQNKIFNELLKLVNLRRTQAEKHIKVYHFCVECINKCQSTNIFDKLGIEKVALLLNLENKELQITLGKVVIEKNLSVKQLQYITLILNKGLFENLNEAVNKTLNLTNKSLREEISKLRKKNSINKNSWQEQYNELSQNFKLLSDENNSLKEKIKVLELQLSNLQNKEILTQNSEEKERA